MGIENDTMTEIKKNHIKENDKNTNTYCYLANACASRSATFSGYPVPTPISEITNDKTPKACGVKDIMMFF